MKADSGFKSGLVVFKPGFPFAGKSDKIVKVEYSGWVDNLRRRIMCVAYPGRVNAVEGRTAKVDFRGNMVDVNIGIVDVAVGDYVLVHAGMAIEAMSEEKAAEILRIFGQMEAMA